MKKILIILFSVIILAIACAYFYTTISPHAESNNVQKNNDIINSNITNTIPSNSDTSSDIFSSYYVKAEEILSNM